MEISWSQAYCDASCNGNFWDNGSLGNYWSDYEMRYPNATNNGVVWDTPYEINGSTTDVDNYPLVHPYIEDKIESLMKAVISEINILKMDIREIDCRLLRKIVSWVVEKAECNIERALDLYLDGNSTRAKIQVWITKWQMCISEFMIKIAAKLNFIEEELAKDLLGQINDIQLKLNQILGLL